MSQPVPHANQPDPLINQQLEARKLLLRRQAELSQRLSALEIDLHQQHHPDWQEQAQERENDEVLERIACQTAQELLQIHNVLQKLGNHTYGVCSHCGEFIGRQRLKAMPAAELCIRCASHTH
ncbi:TraR/DksA family transcriptional regulator [Pseudomaricurvus sp.]|uniref:TraR/DksA family transcriptional regulator n=1 Tax=Pseudomaricurvus sp. TaxID=2004510 RepID=UPI003F6D6804